MSIIVEVSVPNSVQKTYRHEPNQRFNSIDLNRVSGAYMPDSFLMSILLAMRSQFGIFGNSPAYKAFGFKIASYTTAQIVVNPGVLIATEGIYFFEGATLTPTPASYWGLYEIEVVDETGDPVMKSFLDTVPQTFSVQLGDSRKIFRLKLYENYNTTPNFPTITPGRLELINYKKTASLGNIIQTSNVLGKSNTTIGFSTGDIKTTLQLPDGVEWLYCDGSDVPTNFTDLIDLLRSLSINNSTINYTSITNNGSGFCRVNFPSINLKGVNLFPNPDDRENTFELTTSSNPSFPVGTYRIIGSYTGMGTFIDILLAYPGGTATGTSEIRPFSKADVDGGGARTPVVTYLKNALTNDPQDVNRNKFTHQRSKNAIHSHGSVNLSVTGDPDITTGNATSTGPLVNNGGVNEASTGPYILASNTPDGSPRYVDLTVPIDLSGFDVDAGTLDVGGVTDDAEGVIMDSDNQGVARPENLSVYYIIKT